MRIEALKGKNLRVAVYYRRLISDVDNDVYFELYAQNLRGFIESNGWTAQGYYFDEGESTNNLERLIELCKAGEIDLVMTESMTCLDRNLSVVVSIIEEMTALPKPVGIYFRELSLYTLDSFCQYTLKVLSTIAQNE